MEIVANVIIGMVMWQKVTGILIIQIYVLHDSKVSLFPIADIAQNALGEGKLQHLPNASHTISWQIAMILSALLLYVSQV